jgi:hypothetical protein
LADLESKWNEFENRENSRFFQWFERYQAKVFVDAMLKPVRVAAGQGYPPAEFTTNACESGHASLKSYLPKNSSWQEFVQKSYQQQQIEMTVLSRGQYKLKKQ